MRFAHICLVSSVFTLCAATKLNGSVQVTVSTSVASPQPVGSSVSITAVATDSNQGPVTYKFEVALGLGSFSILRDFGLNNAFTWVPTTTNGPYSLRVTARDKTSGESAESTLPFTLSSRVIGKKANVSATNHPLVALFSAQPCQAAALMRVRFWGGANAAYSYTDFRKCQVTTGLNFLIAGMQPNTTYQMNTEVMIGSTIRDSPNIYSFTTGSIPSNVLVPAATLIVPGNSGTSGAERVVLASVAGQDSTFATDLAGNVIWYYYEPSLQQLPRPVQGGTLLALVDGPGTGTGYWGNVTRQQILREVDVAGNVVRETTADRISEQLPMSNFPYGIDRFDHEARKLPNGNYLVLGETQAIFPPGTQGSPVPIDIIGAVILVLDPNFQVLWSWNSFDHAGGGTQLDVNRPPTQGELCFDQNGVTHTGCPPALLSSPAPDWLHANTLQLLSDGNILISMRDQDWLAKVDYRNGSGTGNILWRMGLGGDFTFTGTSDPYPWFSGQHDSEFNFGGLTTLSVFDDGNTRVSKQGGHSRGQVLNVNEAQRTVSFILNADLGVTSFALGSAQPLSNGDWVFGAADIEPLKTTTQSIETNASGVQTFNEQITTDSYRVFRMTDFYNVPTT